MKVEADNMEQFAEKVIELLQHDQTRERYSENSYEVIKEFTGAIVSKQWESLIKDLLLTTPNN